MSISQIIQNRNISPMLHKYLAPKGKYQANIRE